MTSLAFDEIICDHDYDLSSVVAYTLCLKIMGHAYYAS